MNHMKKKVLQHLQDDVYCRLGVSPVHGIGVFAIRDIPKGKDPFKSLLPREYIRLTAEDIGDLPPEVRQQIETFCYSDDEWFDVPVSGLNVPDYVLYVNHSKTPNVDLTCTGDYETLRLIHTGEELLLDYDVAFGGVHVFDD